MLNLDGVTMRVSATAAQGVVDIDTRLHFRQKRERVFGRYSGGSVRRGFLVGRLRDGGLAFRYAQVEASGEVHAGSSACTLIRQPNSALRLFEHFTWRTRAGSGTNVFDEVVPTS